MGVSPRHTRRILADYRKNGAASLAHGHRGRKPANAIPEATRSRVVHLARTVYEGANHTHLSELLSERVGLDMGRTTLRRILVNALFCDHDVRRQLFLPTHCLTQIVTLRKWLPQLKCYRKLGRQPRGRRHQQDGEVGTCGDNQGPVPTGIQEGQRENSGRIHCDNRPPSQARHQAAGRHCPTSWTPWSGMGISVSIQP